MKKILAFTFLAMCFASLCSAGELDIGTHASFYSPPEGGGNTLMVGVDANYRMNDYFSVRGSVDNSNYSTNEHKYSLTMVMVNLIGHLMGKSSVDPYAGAGMGLSDKNTDGSSVTTTALNALAGIAVNIQGLTAGLEIKYTIPDTRDMNTGFYSAGGNLTGGVHLTI